MLDQCDAASGAGAGTWASGAIIAMQAPISATEATTEPPSTSKGDQEFDESWRRGDFEARSEGM
jgi:hypothetical protein